MRKKKVLPPAERHLPNMETFPSDLWLGLWHQAREQGPIVSPSEFPTWMSAEAREEVLAQREVDPEHNSRWLQLLFSSSRQPYPKAFLFTAAAMVATMGWPAVFQDVLKLGAPLRLDRPPEGWGVLFPEKIRLWREAKRDCSLLDVCIMAMRGSTAVSPFHPGRAASLQVLLDAGADPNALLGYTKRTLMDHEALARIMIKAGLDASQEYVPGEKLLTYLFSEDRGVAPAVHGRILKAFIQAGMPVRFEPSGPSVADHVAKSVRSMSQIDVLFDHPDRAGMMAALEEVQPLLFKKSERMNAKVGEGFRQHFQARMLELTTPLAPAVRSRPRL